MKQTTKRFLLSFGLIALFVIFTITLTFVDVKPIGPNGSSVAYATVNKFVKDLFGVNFTLYNITDWAGIVGGVLPMVFAFLGLIQLIKRKSLFKVDVDIVILGFFYLLTIGVYLLFEFVKINYRPVLIGGYLETSYPSSTTLLILCVVPTTAMQIKSRIKSQKLSLILRIICYVFTLLMVVLRLISGVHWFTDILGGTIISLGLIELYLALNLLAKNKRK